MSRIDYDRAAPAYARGRPLPLAAILPWRAAIARHLPAPSDLPVLDLGSGTGWFAAAIAEWFGAAVLALEPAAGMRLRRNARTRIPA